jgi:BirA family transcriptional regulator, biotin operon repressor / biotin---[acetyl-CoA-carboxylase] ligase
MSGGATVRIAGRDVVAFDVLPSTNDEAARLGRAGAPEGTVVWALRQTRGRGRRGRDWVSTAGNLFVSVLFRPQVGPARAAELSFVTALAVAEAVDALNLQAAPGTAPVVCKWPNDVLLDGGKVAGILLESEANPQGGAWVVSGIGVNLSDHPLNVERRAASLPHAVKPEAALEALLPALDRRYTQWRAEGFAPIRTAWLQKAVGVGKMIAVRLAHETVEGIFHGLDSDGVLLLDVGQGLPLRRITAGDVFFAGEA